MLKFKVLEQTPQRLRCRLVGLEAPAQLRVEATGAPLELCPEALLAAALPLAMAQRQSLQLDPLDPHLLKALPALQTLYERLPNRLQPIEVVSSPAPASRTRASGVGCFFSKGLDSFYTFLEQHEDITHLLWIRGFDSPAHLQDEMLEPIRQLAERHGKTLVEIRTNLVRWARPHVPWSTYHGNCLFTLAHLLKGTLGKVYIPATGSFERLLAWGSHPQLDGLWSSSDLEIVHHGKEAGRAEKLSRWGQNPELVSNLQVCRGPRAAGQRNCGRCDKCLRTLLAWQAAGNSPDRNWKPRLRDLLALKPTPCALVLWEVLLQECQRMQAPWPTRRAVRLALSVLYLKAGWNQLRYLWQKR